MSEKVGVAVKTPESKGKEHTLAKTKAGFSPSVDINSPVGQILHLQRTIGNQAVTRLIRSGVLQAKGSCGVSDAAAIATEINAKAFTTGRDIFFGAGQYSPTTSTGKHLLAHELTHVLQQGKGQNADIMNRIQRIPANPSGTPFDGEIIPWSAALRSTPQKDPENPHRNTIADLPRGQRVRVLGGSAWIFVKTYINNIDRVGYVSHELIREVSGAASPTFTTDKGDPISTSGGSPVPSLEYEKKWMKDKKLTDKVRRVPNTASSDYNCHGFVYLNAMAWVNDPTPIIKDNDYYVPTKPRIGDAVVYTTSTLSLNEQRRPIISSIPPHSGLVTRGSEGSPTEVTSKWGSWHIYKHAPRDVWSEYGQPTYLRSDRTGGHTVSIT